MSEEMLEEIAERAAAKAIKALKDSDAIKHQKATSFRRVEKILFLLPKLPDDNEEKKRVMSALEQLRDDEYFGVIESYYFDQMTFEEIAEIYDCKYQTISKNRTRLVKHLASDLFPEEVLAEIMRG